MQFKSNLRCLTLLILAQFILLLGGYYSWVKSEEDSSTICRSTWIQFWIMTYSFINMLLMFMISSNLFRHNNTTDHSSLGVKSNSNHRSPFRSAPSYDLIHIRPSTTTRVLDDITFHLRGARKYIMTSKPNVADEKKMLLYIDASLPIRSLIIVIDYDHERDANTTYASTLYDIFKLVFERSKFVLAWGDLRVHLQCFLDFRLFSDRQLIEVYPIDLQQMFREWHSQWLNRLDDSTIMIDPKKKSDNCSCDHCPKICKTFHSWSLSDAISFCFNEYFDDDHCGINHCFATGKISDFIRNPPI